ncbi:nitroreductase family deazaflavin-dependent oxidoreductase [Actinoplanes bogorensis]|uniref:Nitroreductase family deazaflavin-dependent oxidoreductase n=1 Tax=Paractinoplanes bogorensis TaxID=1610840 RepID=A0ABS5Z105_9ACTN|nr:nitroreductase/quinone reductase family protein [Actinoplanes bogorensis]MBU2669338.1 nitroreductase family deazaflavin-dependent oxidoreductase [Actinoplanes bogorensis]
MSNWTDPAIGEFQRSGGNHPRFGRDLVLLHGIGARSGTPRPHLTRGIAFRDGWVVAATFGGNPKNPAWVNNLRAHPDIDLEVPLPRAGTKTYNVHATELAGPDREEARRLFHTVSPVFPQFEASITRLIPIFLLTPHTS